MLDNFNPRLFWPDDDFTKFYSVYNYNGRETMARPARRLKNER